MRKYLVVKLSNWGKMMDCFSSMEEYLAFMETLNNFVSDYHCDTRLVERREDDKEFRSAVEVKKLFMFCHLIKSNIELIKQLVNAEYQLLSKEECEEMRNDPTCYDIEDQ